MPPIAGCCVVDGCIWASATAVGIVMVGSLGVPRWTLLFGLLLILPKDEISPPAPPSAPAFSVFLRVRKVF